MQIIQNAREDGWIITCRVRVANSTPMVDLDSRQNSFLVNLERMLDLPTPESPMRTILNK